MNRVELYTDGACSGNPGPGGWAAVLVWGDVVRKLSGYASETTNNRMELEAVIQGLRALKVPCRVEVTTDSSYVKNAFTEGWLKGWLRNGWRARDGKPVKNQELWQQLIALEQTHQVVWHWVRGHSGHFYNEMCDQLAREAIRLRRGGDEKSVAGEGCP